MNVASSTPTTPVAETRESNSNSFVNEEEQSYKEMVDEEDSWIQENFNNIIGFIASICMFAVVALFLSASLNSEKEQNKNVTVSDRVKNEIVVDSDQSVENISKKN